MDDDRFVGKVCLVTGAGRGIGAGIAETLATLGTRVTVADVDLDVAEAVATKIRHSGGAARAAQVDVTSEDSVAALVAGVLAEEGRLDFAVNSAGVFGVAQIADLTVDDWDRVFDVNAKGVFLSCKYEVEAMRNTAAGGGRIINIASLAGRVGIVRQSHYSASKFAVVGFTNALAKEIALEGITVNSICPGIVGTRMWRGEGGTAEAKQKPGETEEESWLRNQKEELPQGIAQTVDDIAETVVFLIKSPHITAQAISVDGGAGQ